MWSFERAWGNFSWTVQSDATRMQPHSGQNPRCHQRFDQGVQEATKEPAALNFIFVTPLLLRSNFFFFFWVGEGGKV